MGSVGDNTNLVDGTIAQIATATGAGGVGIVRLSGPSARRIGRELIGRSVDDAPQERTAVWAAATDGRETVDTGLYLEFVGPRSFTGEDVAEFQGHGGAVGLSRVLARCVALGARPAGPGEFTLRAFRNGKLDLAQAEAIADGVAAQTEHAQRLAQRQAQGELSRRIAALRAPLIDAASALNADVDFPDEDLGRLDTAAVLVRLGEGHGAIDALLQGYDAARLLRHGAVVAIAGPPNAGKSSLFNALVGFDRAIVSPLAGTTRDTIEERVVFGGVAVRLVDTAGLRASGDVLEEAGMARARQVMTGADLVICLTSADTEWGPFAEELATHPRVLWVCNKIDLGEPSRELTAFLLGRKARRLSLRLGEGVDQVRAALVDKLGVVHDADVLVTAERHATLLREAAAALERAQATLRAGGSSELVLVDVNISIHRLGAVVGERLTEAVLADIFSRFCIGK